MYSYLLNTDNFTLQSIFQPNGGNYYRPVLIVSYMMDKYVWGLEESFMHLENIIFHLFNTLLVFAIARKAAKLQGLRLGVAPLAAALFFAIHPLNTEVVAWVAGRTDLLAGFFIFLSVWLLLRQSSRFAISILAASCMLIACLAKETAIFFLPAAMLLPFFIPETENAKVPLRLTILRNVPHLLIFSLSGAAYFAFRSGAFTRSDAGVSQVLSHVGGEKSAGLLPVLSLTFKAAGFYLKKLFLPFPLNFGITHVSELYLPVGILLLVFLLWLLTRRSLPSYFFLCAAAVGSSALLVPLLKVTWTPLAERYMYIPSAFFITGLTFALQRWGKLEQYKGLIIGMSCAVALVFAYGTVSRTILWQDNLALYQDTLRKSPDFVPAQNEIANALFAKGRNREATAILAALKLPEGLINSQYGMVSKSAAAANSGDFVQARLLLTQVQKNPGKQEVDILLRLLKLHDLEVNAGLSAAAEAYPERIRLLTRLLALTGDPFYLYRLGVVHLAQQERGLALAAFRKAAALAPADAYYRRPARQLSAALAAKPDRSPAGGEKL